MNRELLEDKIADAKRTLAFYVALKTGCQNCEHMRGHGCTINGGERIPANFIPVGCAAWEFDEIPF